MAKLTQSEKEFVSIALVSLIVQSSGEWMIATLARSAEIAFKLGCTKELREAAENFQAMKGGKSRPVF